MRRLVRDDSSFDTVVTQALAQAAAALVAVHATVHLTPNGRLMSEDFDRSLYACDQIRDYLWNHQLLKCCYCEKPLEKSYQHVEHYRPKTRARRSRTLFEEGYWWLAYSLQNLLYSCPDCNVNKNDWFPLKPGSKPGTVEDGVDNEEPEILNPLVDDPAEHLTFVRLPHNLGWKIAARTDRGQVTIDRLGLDRDNLDKLRNRVAVEVEAGRDHPPYVDAASDVANAFSLLRSEILKQPPITKIAESGVSHTGGPL